jgi:hypothetical protein
MVPREMATESAAGGANPFVQGARVRSIMDSPKSLEPTCDVCHSKVTGGLRTWRRRLPSHDVVGICASCSYRLTRSADGRGIESEDMMHMASVYRTLAGEVWGDADRIYWFKQPFVHRPKALMADILDRQKPQKPTFSDLTRTQLARAGVKL